MFRPAKFIFLRTFSQSAAHRICQPCCSSINSSNLTETTSVLSGNKRNFSDKNEKPEKDHSFVDIASKTFDIGLKRFYFTLTSSDKSEKNMEYPVFIVMGEHNSSTRKTRKVFISIIATRILLQKLNEIKSFVAANKESFKDGTFKIQYSERGKPILYQTTFDDSIREYKLELSCQNNRLPTSLEYIILVISQENLENRDLRTVIFISAIGIPYLEMALQELLKEFEDLSKDSPRQRPMGKIDHSMF
uniref:Uncharacterized protein n=1 Tax=Acrobeloides nanus TaxID=290746 RepID=A0A914E0B8_9BILA